MTNTEVKNLVIDISGDPLKYILLIVHMNISPCGIAHLRRGMKPQM